MTSDPRATGRSAGRPRVGWIIALIIAGVGLLTSLGVDLMMGGALEFTLGLALAVAPMPLLLAAVLALDRLEPEPRSALIFAFVWGAGIAVLVAGALNSAGLVYLQQAAGVGAERAHNLVATFGAPAVEESLKGLVLLGMLRYRRQEIDGPTDGIIYASMVGLGFAMTENVSYYIFAQASPETGGLAATVVLRGILSPFAHPLFTSMIGVAVAYVATRRIRRRVPVLAAGWIGAMALHGLWNGMASYGGLTGLGLAYLVLLLIMLVLIGVIIVERQRVVRLIRDYLPDYFQTGIVTPADVEMLSSLRMRRQARHEARLRAGVRAVRIMGNYQQAATELVLLRQREERGVVSGPEFLAGQDTLLQNMAQLRAAIGDLPR